MKFHEKCCFYIPMSIVYRFEIDSQDLIVISQTSINEREPKIRIFGKIRRMGKMNHTWISLFPFLPTI